MLRPDIWGGHHTEYFDLLGKRERATPEGVAAWVDPEGYRRFVAHKRARSRSKSTRRTRRYGTRSRRRVLYDPDSGVEHREAGSRDIHMSITRRTTVIREWLIWRVVSGCLTGSIPTTRSSLRLSLHRANARVGYAPSPSH